jgi:hypothetical protein
MFKLSNEFASLRYRKKHHYRSFRSLRFASISMPLKGHGNEADFLICYLVLIFSDFAADHGLINYIERNLSKSLSSKKFFTCKGTLRQVFITVYRLELHFNHNTCRISPFTCKNFLDDKLLLKFLKFSLLKFSKFKGLRGRCLSQFIGWSYISIITPAAKSLYRSIFR